MTKGRFLTVLDWVFTTIEALAGLAFLSAIAILVIVGTVTLVALAFGLWEVLT